MVETLFFIGGTLLGFLICSISFKSGSKSVHQAYDIIYTTPGPQESEEDEPKLTQDELYDWQEYNSSIKWQEFEEDDDNLEEKPN
tara:strand:- start:4530 stop:4784 length:255 start_codon:yes stop_codon:yes gene_type:complete